MASTADPSEATIRTCVVCRAARPTRLLVRIGLVHGRVVLGRAPRGRGAHVCLSRTCLLGLSQRVLARAFRRDATGTIRPPTLADLHQLAERRLLEYVGLARRQGILQHGVERLAGSDVAGAILVASDLSPRSIRQLSAGQRVFVDGHRLGHAAGMGWVGAVRIAVGRLADEAEYWFALWYECRVKDPPVTVDAGSKKEPMADEGHRTDHEVG